jgi:hypothetical protein
MPRCPNDKTLDRYLDGELGDATAARLRRHLADCGRCAERYELLRGVEQTLRGAAPPEEPAPDLAPRVTGELARRGAFFRARVAAGRRRLVGDGLRSWRMGLAVSAAVGVVLLGLSGMDYLSRVRWVRHTEPVLADAERVLVRLVYVKPEEEGRRLAWARDQVRKLDLAERLVKARSTAGPAWARDLAPLEATFTLLAQEDPLPPGVADELSGGQLLVRASRLRETLARGG